MRISELSRVSGVPVATIKFYLRERLLPDGVRSSANQAQYDDTHVQRLRLIRALVGVGGLSLTATKDVLRQIDEPTGLTLDLLGAAHQAVAPTVTRRCRPRAGGEPAAPLGLGHLRGRGGHGDQGRVDDALAALATALGALEDAGFEVPAARLDTYAEAMMQVAHAEIAGLPMGSADGGRALCRAGHRPGRAGAAGAAPAGPAGGVGGAFPATEPNFWSSNDNRRR